MSRIEQAIFVMADDDEDDRMLAERAFQRAQVVGVLQFVKDGEELINYLRHRDRYSDRQQSPRPHVILLDLNMPRKDGRETLREIRKDPDLSSIPIVVLTTSRAEEDVRQCYQSGANSFITKPLSLPGLVELMKSLNQYWLEVVTLPQRDS